MEFPHGSKNISFSTTSDQQTTSNPSIPPQPVEMDHMFSKVVTPSDVGKLNRLVLPKQYAEKYFPIDSTANHKGLLLSFEDRHGKPWCFRYSYWNSSQSYVITKGWSRFVKDHRLDAGDTVSFSRGQGHRLFIDFKRRQPPLLPAASVRNFSLPLLSFDRSTFFPTSGRQYLYYPSAATELPCVGLQDRMLDSVPVVSRPAAAKRVRLFGVNLEGPESNAGVAPPKMAARLVGRSELPHLQLRIGGFSEEQETTLNLDL